MSNISAQKLRIIEAFAELIRTEGYHNASIAKLARKVNLRKASIYHHVSSKDEILDLIIIEVVHVVETIRKQNDRNDRFKQFVNYSIEKPFFNAFLLAGIELAEINEKITAKLKNILFALANNFFTNDEPVTLKSPLVINILGTLILGKITKDPFLIEKILELSDKGRILSS